MRIADPARRHGVADEDIEHAVRNAMVQVRNDDDRFTMLIGPSGGGQLLEIGILDLDGDDPVIIHSMALRPKFYPFLSSIERLDEEA